MNWVVHQSYLPPQPTYFLVTPPPPAAEADDFSLSSRVSPSILLIIIILAIIFFVSGLLHLLVRFLMRPPARDMDNLDSDVTALQGQLQQLFHLHDAGVDQTFIDTLPVFHYKAIIGLKNPFDCAVCLCEFDADDKLRLLPKCSHAFHMECIDTWLLSHSTCPLCRANLLLDFSSGNGGSPLVFILQSGSESSREITADRDTNTSDVPNTRSGHVESDRKSPEKPDCENIVAVKLGKFKNVDGGEGSSSICSNVDSRRCFSMGSFEYVMDDTATLQVPIIPPTTVQKYSNKKKKPLKLGQRLAISECDPQSRRFVKESRKIENRESFSVSKIWSSSFRFPMNRSAAVEAENGSEIGGEEENQSVYSLDSQASNLRAPSFTRRTLLWLMGRQSINSNKVGHSSSSLDHV